VLVQDSCMVYVKCTIGLNVALDNLMVPLGYEAQVDVRFVQFGDSANPDTR
jgi:hypothetical protein